MLTCKETMELIADYLERRLTFRQRLRFQFHLGMCRHCRAYLRQMRATIRLLGKLDPEPIPTPPQMPEDLLKRFRDWKR